MNYKDAIDVLFTKLPMFQRTGPAAYKANLDGTIAVCQMLNNPQNNLKFVHIAGTNGKGTVAHMISSVLQKSGYKVGLFTSPHLIDFRERIRINGEMIPEQDVVNFVESYSEIWNTPSFFELTFGMAIQYFDNEKCDIVILETGMGGRLDSTNVIPSAEVSVVTNVGLDHQQFLGQTIREIATEKAGILKPGVPVVLGKMRPEAQSVVLDRAMKTSSEMFYGRTPPQDLNPDSNPTFLENASTTFETLRVLNLQGWNIEESTIAPALNNYRSISGQRGRAEIIPASEGLGNLILDCAHNLDGVRKLLSSLQGQLHIVFGAVADKDPRPVLSLIPAGTQMYWCAANIVRAMDPDTLANHGKSLGLTGTTFPSVRAATQAARQATSSNDNTQAVVCGSVFVLGEALD